MFRLHRSDRLALALIVLAAGLGLSFWGVTGTVARALGVVRVEDAVRAADPRTAGLGPGIPVEMSSLPSGFSVAGTYRGWISLEEGDLVFRIPDAMIRTRADTDGEQILVGLRLALARTSGTSWTTVEKGPILPVRKPLAKGREFRLRDLELRVGDIHPWDLRGTWPVLVHELEVGSPDPQHHSGPAWTYVHGTRESMEALRRKAEQPALD